MRKVVIAENRVHNIEKLLNFQLIAHLKSISSRNASFSNDLLLLGVFEIRITRKYPLRGYILGVLTHTTALD